MRVGDVYRSGGKWLRADDFRKPNGGYGTSRAEIEHVHAIEVDDRFVGRRVSRLEVAFVGKTKRLLLNKTNATTLATAFGDETDGWIGRKVRLFTRATDKGQGVRIEPLAGQEQQP